MSKMDDMRAMREARYARRAAGGDQPTSPARRAPAVAPPGAATSAPRSARSGSPGADAPAGDAAPESEALDDLCGHRNMTGRTCTRERGHAAKSHRYS